MVYCKYCSSALCLIHLSDFSPNNYPRNKGSWYNDYVNDEEVRFSHTCKGCRNPSIDNTNVKLLCDVI